MQGAKFSHLGGAVTWHNDVGRIVQHLATAYGSSTLKFSDADFDATKMAAFVAAHPQPIGLYLRDRSNVIEVINRVASSLGCRLTIDANGLASLVKLGTAVSGTTTAVGPAEVKDKTLRVSSLPPVVAAIKMGYCKNWTVQPKLETGIVSEHAAMYAEEWLTQTVENTATAANFNLFTEPVLTETLLLTASDAIVEANRRLAVFDTQRKVLSYSGVFHLVEQQIGGEQVLTNSRFGLSSGKSGQIISISTDFVNPDITFEVLI